MRIALVDPSRTTRLIVARMLEARGHDVVPFCDGHEALSRIAVDLGIEALITSAELPSISGVELCWETRLLATYGRPIYVLLLSTQYDQRCLIEALDSGADDFISKPPLAEELYARLRAAERIASMQRELVWLATTDALTGLCNRRAFFERATEVCQHAVDRAITAIVWDIDNFKAVNDTYGHHVGDEAIRACARAACKREEVLVGRVGGDEFAMVLERRSLAEAIEVAEDLRLRLAEGKIETDQGRLTITCSMGVSEAEPGDNVDQLLRRADGALYDAKTGGRNRVVGAHPGLPMADTPRYVTRATVR